MRAPWSGLLPASKQRPESASCCTPRWILSGLLDRIDRWSHFQVTPEELMGHADATAAALRARVGGPFDVVLSACMLSQMQLSVLNVLSEQHRLFQAVRWTLNLTHFRTLAALTRPSGRALFATDVSSGALHAFDALAPASDCVALRRGARRSSRRVFDFADPKRIAALFSDDPLLRAGVPALRGERRLAVEQRAREQSFWSTRASCGAFESRAWYFAFADVEDAPTACGGHTCSVARRKVSMP